MVYDIHEWAVIEISMEQNGHFEVVDGAISASGRYYVVAEHLMEKEWIERIKSEDHHTG